MKMTVLWDVTLCSLSETDGCFRGAKCHQLESICLHVHACYNQVDQRLHHRENLTSRLSLSQYVKPIFL